MAYVVCANWTAREEEIDAVANAVPTLAAASRAEPGNLTYVVHRSPEDQRVFFLYESYVDSDAYEAHLASSHFQRALTDVIPLLESRERQFYETWAV